MAGCDSISRLGAILDGSPLLATVLARWADIMLPDCWLVAAALAQTVWNTSFGLPPAHGIVDLDLVYFDRDDMSEEGEVAQSARTTAELNGP